MALFPAQLRQAFTQWKTASASIDDRDVQVLEGSAPGQLPVKLFFDAESGLFSTATLLGIPRGANSDSN